MNAIPQRAYDNYERIQIPRVRPQVQERDRVSDMEAYRIQKIAAERRRLQQQDEARRAAYNTGATQGKGRQIQQKRQQPTQNRRSVQERQELREAQQRREMQQQQRRREMQQREVQGERYRIRQSGVQNIVGGRQLTPAYEGGYASSYSNERTSARREAGYRGQSRANTQRYARSEYARPRQAVNYGGYTAAEKKSARSYARTTDIRNTAYNGVKPIAVEYESPKKKGVVSTILLIAVVFAILSGLVIRYATISNVNYQNAQIQSQNSGLADQLEKVKMDNALKEDLSSVQQKASTALGMYYPTDDQIEYLEPDTVETSNAVNSGVQVEEQIIQNQETVMNENSSGGIQSFFAGLVEAIGSWFQG